MITTTQAKPSEWTCRWIVVPEESENSPLKRKNGKLYVRYDRIDVSRTTTGFWWKNHLVATLTHPAVAEPNTTLCLTALHLVATLTHPAVAEPNTTLCLTALKGLLQINIK